MHRLVSKASSIAPQISVAMDGIIMMLPEPLQRFSTHMDFPGQHRAERIYQIILVISGIVGFIVGFTTQQLSHAVFTVLGGAVIASLVVLFPWPCFRRHPIQWLPVKESGKDGEEKKETKKTK